MGGFSGSRGGREDPQAQSAETASDATHGWTDGWLSAEKPEGDDGDDDCCPHEEKHSHDSDHCKRCEHSEEVVGELNSLDLCVECSTETAY